MKTIDKGTAHFFKGKVRREQKTGQKNGMDCGCIYTDVSVLLYN